MRVVSLASGSKGNAYCVEAQGRVLLIDCGLHCRELEARMRAAGLAPAQIIAAAFTHNHDDHVKGLPVFHRHHPQVELLANLMTADAIAGQLGMDALAFSPFENGQAFDVGPFCVRAFAIPHDVPDPVGYLVSADGQTYFHCTDCGTPLDSVGVKLAEADFATLESNHDPVMLHDSPRAESLKRRIRGPRGHLSNDEAADLVRRFASPRLRRLALAHLSGECNVPHLAVGAMKAAFADLNRTDIELRVLEQDETVEI